MKSRDFSVSKFYLLALLSLRCTQVLCVSDVFGKTFILSLPTFRSDRGVYFSIFTLQETRFTVNFTTPGGTENDTVYSPIWLSRREPVHYSVTKERKHNGTSITFTHRLSAEHKFRLSVLLMVGSMGVESLQAVPVEGWGMTYYVVSLGPQPSVQIMASQETRVNICLRSSNGRPFSVNYNGVVYSKPSQLPIVLKSNQAFSLQKCAEDNVDYGDLNGTKIEGDKPIGVITGSCGGDNYDAYCESKANTSYPYAYIAEMLLPVETFGDEFITLQLDMARGSGYTVFMAAHPKTVLRIYSMRLRTRKEKLDEAGDTLEVSGPPTYVSCFKPVQAVYIHRSICPENNVDLLPGTVAMAILSPMRFLMDSFFWHTPNDSVISCQHHVVIVYQEDSVKFIQVDNRSLSSIHRKDVEVLGRRAWKVTELDINPGPHAVHSDRNVLLGLYLYGTAVSLSYLQTAGFKSTRRNTFCKPFVPELEPGDLLDNDCDGRIDEEILDGQDDDDDNQIDEDTRNLPTRNGGWTEWSRWFCKDNSDKIMYRSRECSAPFPSNGGYRCVGKDTGSKQGSCEEITNTATASALKSSENKTSQTGTANGTNTTLDTRNVTRSTSKTTTTDVNNATATTTQPPNTSTEGELNSFLNSDYSTSTLEPNDVDFSKHLLQEGQWGKWSEWLCTECGDQKQARTRHCIDTPCDGFFIETRNAKCHIECPLECPPYRWGPNCTGSCENCLSSCDKEEGVCSSCRKGFRDPLLSCSKKCGPFTYGENCRWSCKEKCGGVDCIDSVEGTCPETQSPLWFLWFLVLVLPVSTMLYIRSKIKITRGRRKKKLREKLINLEMGSTFLPLNSNVGGDEEPLPDSPFYGLGIKNSSLSDSL